VSHRLRKTLEQQVAPTKCGKHSVDNLCPYRLVTESAHYSNETNLQHDLIISLCVITSKTTNDDGIANLNG